MILLNIMNMYIEKKVLKDYNLSKKIFKDKNEYVSINIIENYYNNIENLNDYIINLIKDKKINIDFIIKIIFKILFIFENIQDKYQNFRHNNLVLKNIMIQFNNKSNNIYNTKFINFELENDNFELKIYNFHNSILNNNIYYKNIDNNKKIKNRYYDIYTIFTDIKNILITNNLNFDKLNIFFDKYIIKKY